MFFLVSEDKEVVGKDVSFVDACSKAIEYETTYFVHVYVLQVMWSTRMEDETSEPNQVVAA